MGGRYDASFNPRERAPGADRGPPERSSFGPPRGGGDRSFGRDRDGPSSFGGRDGPSSFSRDGGRDGSSSYGRDRDGPSSFSRDRDSGPPSYGRDRDGPSSYGGGRDRDGPSSFSRDRPSGDGNSYGRDREQRPPVERGNNNLVSLNNFSPIDLYFVIVHFFSWRWRGRRFRSAERAAQVEP